MNVQRIQYIHTAPAITSGDGRHQSPGINHEKRRRSLGHDG
jgi:hypothetical protein